ncbi:MAG TPA: hypothetical protein V6C97_31980 [Oculatellaceae cyanobacterium]
MKKKAAFFIPYFWSPHLETDLEIIHKHVSDGDEVIVYICNGELPTCYSNVSHDPHICNLCSLRRRNGFNLTGLIEKVHFKNFVSLTSDDLAIFKQFQGVVVHELSELLQIKLEQFFLGRTVYNELVSLRSESEVDFTKEQEYLTKAIESGALVYLSFKNHFASTKPDIFYTFNGRFVIAQPAVDAAVASGVPYAVHDRFAGVMNRYSLVQNESLNNLSYWKDQIRTFWDESKDTVEQRRSYGAKWFDDRAQGKKQGWFSFTADQESGLPKGFDTSKENVVVFVSSDWENTSSEYQLPFYDSQNEALLRLANDLQGRDNLQVYIRLHPNMKGKQNAQNAFIAEKITDKFPNVMVISPESAVSTYALMVKVDLVITFGSTTGIEAAYHGVHSLLAGQALYEDLGACTVAKSHEEIVQLISDRTYKLTDAELEHRKSNALRYGYFHQRAGYPYTIFEQTDIFEMKHTGALNYGRTITYDPPNYEEGLRRELAQRLELSNEAPPSPLSGTVRELLETSDKLADENSQLKAVIAQLKEANRSMKTSLAESAQSKLVNNGQLTTAATNEAELLSQETSVDASSAESIQPKSSFRHKIKKLLGVQ